MFSVALNLPRSIEERYQRRLVELPSRKSTGENWPYASEISTRVGKGAAGFATGMRWCIKELVLAREQFMYLSIGW